MAKRKIDWDENKLKNGYRKEEDRGKARITSPGLLYRIFQAKAGYHVYLDGKQKEFIIFYGFGDTIFLPVGMGG